MKVQKAVLYMTISSNYTIKMEQFAWTGTNTRTSKVMRALMGKGTVVFHLQQKKVWVDEQSAHVLMKHILLDRFSVGFYV